MRKKRCGSNPDSKKNGWRTLLGLPSFGWAWGSASYPMIRTSTPTRQSSAVSLISREFPEAAAAWLAVNEYAKLLDGFLRVRHFQNMAPKHKKLPGRKGIPGTTTYIRVVRLGRWFPARDPLAASMARLIILREDSNYRESTRLLSPPWTLLSTHRGVCTFSEVPFGRFREIQGALTTIRANPESQKRSFKEQSQLTQISVTLNSAALLTKEIRNAVGGHVPPEAVIRALDNMSSERWAS